MRLASALLLAGLTAGCSTPPPIVEVPVAVSCIPQGMPDAPATASNAELRAMTDERLVLTIAAERLDLISYAGQASAVISACR